MIQPARTSEQIKAGIEERFGFFPLFFSPALETPEVLENLWQQTLSAYVNNPLPALIRKKLFARLSRYCIVPYCIVCHSCALLRRPDYRSSCTRRCGEAGRLPLAVAGGHRTQTGGGRT